jgi:hypothetical protein
MNALNQRTVADQIFGLAPGMQMHNYMPAPT